MTCHRCGKPATEQHPLRRVDKHSASGGGSTVWLHDRCPSKALSRTRSYPA